jgi:hypothetical protein
LKSGLIRGAAFGEMGLTRGAAFGEMGLIRGAAIGEMGLIRRAIYINYCSMQFNFKRFPNETYFIY